MINATPKAGPRQTLSRLLRAVDAAPAGKQPELQAALERAAAKSGKTVAQLREFAFGPRQYDFNGLAGCVIQSRSRITGTLAGLYQADQAGLDPDAGPWATVCEDHSTCINHDTLRLARAHLPDPSMWCDDCREKLTSAPAKTA
ncbi:hypothetical protein [Ralstonia sp. ASV6]|uniref:hypothetical protein n=1 Tax=Ralstonia sp. ASV6 TaxID=2795124 RepID=UPI0018EBB995|nr:hypothetical protein [Ralstonia sp. ASV6]